MIIFTDFSIRFISESSHAVEILERFRHGLNKDGDYEYDRDISDMIQMLDSPLFKQICNVQDSLQVNWLVKHFTLR